MAIHIDDYEQIIDGSGANNITSVLDEAIKLAQEDNARIKIYFRVKETGTPSLRKVNEFRFDPGVSSVEDVKRQIVQKLNEDPGPEFSGQLRIELQNASNSTQYVDGDLTFSGPTTIYLDATLYATPGTYVLFEVTGAVSGLANVTIISEQGLFPGPLSNVGGVISVTLS